MNDELKIVSGAHFANEDVELDGIEFHDCSFINCDLIYRGGQPFMFIRSPITQCSIAFCDAAMETMHALAALHRFGMHEFVEEMFQKVRNPFQDSVQ